MSEEGKLTVSGKGICHHVDIREMGRLRATIPGCEGGDGKLIKIEGEKGESLTIQLTDKQLSDVVGGFMGGIF